MKKLRWVKIIYKDEEISIPIDNIRCFYEYEEKTIIVFDGIWHPWLKGYSDISVSEWNK